MIALLNTTIINVIFLTLLDHKKEDLLTKVKKERNTKDRDNPCWL